jgi:hypothetical protein
MGLGLKSTQNPRKLVALYVSIQLESHGNYESIGLKLRDLASIDRLLEILDIEFTQIELLGIKGQFMMQSFIDRIFECEMDIIKKATFLFKFAVTLVQNNGIYENAIGIFDKCIQLMGNDTTGSFEIILLHGKCLCEKGLSAINSIGDALIQDALSMWSASLTDVAVYRGSVLKISILNDIADEWIEYLRHISQNLRIHKSSNLLLLVHILILRLCSVCQKFDPKCGQYYINCSVISELFSYS